MAEPSQERLDELDERITAARRDAEEDGLLPEEDEPDAGPLGDTDVEPPQ